MIGPATSEKKEEAKSKTPPYHRVDDNIANRELFFGNNATAAMHPESTFPPGAKAYFSAAPL